MGLKREIFQELGKIRAEVVRIGARLDEAELRNEQLEGMNERLLAERDRLLDRIMSVDYTKFQLYQAQGGDFVPGSLSFDQLEELAGEVVTPPEEGEDAA